MDVKGAQALRQRLEQSATERQLAEWLAKEVAPDDAHAANGATSGATLAAPGEAAGLRRQAAL